MKTALGIGWLPALLAGLLAVGAAGASSQQQQQPQQDSTSHQFSCGKLYYRTFHLDQQRNVLYVGAM